MCSEYASDNSATEYVFYNFRISFFYYLIVGVAPHVGKELENMNFTTLKEYS